MNNDLSHSQEPDDQDRNHRDPESSNPLENLSFNNTPADGRQNIQSLSFERVTNKNDPRLHEFSEVYREAFGGPPYFEKYTDSQLKEIWDGHIENVMILAMRNGRVVGFGCSHPVAGVREDDVRSFIEAHSDHNQLPVEKTVFMSDLGVLESVRGCGLGTKLILERLIEAEKDGYTHYAMRTAAINSNSERIYRSAGAKALSGVQQVGPGEVETESTERIFLYGETATAISRIRAILQTRND